MTQEWSQPGVLLFNPRVVTAWSAGIDSKAVMAWSASVFTQWWSLPWSAGVFNSKVVTAWSADHLLVVRLLRE